MKSQLQRILSTNLNEVDEIVYKRISNLDNISESLTQRSKMLSGFQMMLKQEMQKVKISQQHRQEGQIEIQKLEQQLQLEKQLYVAHQNYQIRKHYLSVHSEKKQLKQTQRSSAKKFGQIKKDQSKQKKSQTFQNDKTNAFRNETQQNKCINHQFKHKPEVSSIALLQQSMHTNQNEELPIESRIQGINRLNNLILSDSRFLREENHTKRLLKDLQFSDVNSEIQFNFQTQRLSNQQIQAKSKRQRNDTKDETLSNKEINTMLTSQFIETVIKQRDQYKHKFRVLSSQVKNLSIFNRKLKQYIQMKLQNIGSDFCESLALSLDQVVNQVSQIYEEKIRQMKGQLITIAKQLQITKLQRDVMRTSREGTSKDLKQKKTDFIRQHSLSQQTEEVIKQNWNSTMQFKSRKQSSQPLHSYVSANYISSEIQRKKEKNKQKDVGYENYEKYENSFLKKLELEHMQQKLFQTSTFKKNQSYQRQDTFGQEDSKISSIPVYKDKCSLSQLQIYSNIKRPMSTPKHNDKQNFKPFVIKQQKQMGLKQHSAANKSKSNSIYINDITSQQDNFRNIQVTSNHKFPIRHRRKRSGQINNQSAIGLLMSFSSYQLEPQQKSKKDLPNHWRKQKLQLYPENQSILEFNGETLNLNHTKTRFKKGIQMKTNQKKNSQEKNKKQVKSVSYDNSKSLINDSQCPIVPSLLKGQKSSRTIQLPKIKEIKIQCPPVNRGYGIYKINDVQIYKGMWQNGKFHGRGKLKVSGYSYQGDFKEGNFDGYGTLIIYGASSQQGKIRLQQIRGHFKQNKVHGEATRITNGQTLMGQWIQNRLIQIY